MSDTPDLRTIPASELIDRLCDEFEAGWLANSPSRLEDMVLTVPDHLRGTLFRELLAIEREYRRKDGRPVTLDEARQRFSGLGSWAEDVARELLDATVTDPGKPPSEPRDPFSVVVGHPDGRLPTTVGKFRIVRKLGEGGMGIVYLADDPDGRRQVAVKVLKPVYAADPVARERFLREARAAMAVENDHVVHVYQVEENSGSPYMVMPFLKGESLEDRLSREPLPPLSLVLKIGREVAEGLAAAHEKGLIHRDVKPSNIWLEGDPASANITVQVRRAKVLDFGLARASDGTDRVSLPGSIVGTPAYMAPEQAEGRGVDGRADLFSLGAVLYRMAVGRPAFAGPSLSATLRAVSNHHPPPPNQLNPAVTPALSALIVRLLEKDAPNRPQSAHEVVDALASIEKGQLPPRVTSHARRRWLLIGCGLLALCAIAIGGRSLFHEPKPTGTSQGDTKGTETPSVPPAPAQQTNLPSAQPEALRVKSLELKHYTKTPEGDVPRGILGKESFFPLRGDKVHVVANLSKPAYAYIVAFRPDGVAELCFPNDEDTVPPLTDTPRYPAPDSTKSYGLDEGTGLWVFAVVTSEKPLPTYRQWLASRKLNWQPEAAPTGSVWWYDGAVLETFFQGGSAVRAKEVELTGPAANVRSLGRWLEQAADVKVGVLGFGVGKRN